MYAQDAEFGSCVGEYIGIVEDTNDPLHIGRLRVRVSSIHRDQLNIPTQKLPWAHYKTPFGGGIDYGFYMIPPIGSQVTVTFLNGHPDFPFWTGCLWGAPRNEFGVPQPEGLTDAKAATIPEQVFQIKTPGVPISNGYGHTFRMDDNDDTRHVQLKTRDTHNLLFDDINDFIQLTSEKGHYRRIDDPNDYIEDKTVYGHALKFSDPDTLIRMETGKATYLEMGDRGTDGDQSFIELATPDSPHRMLIDESMAYANIAIETGDGMRIHLYDTFLDHRIKLTSDAGYRIEIAEDKQFIEVMTAGGRFIRLDDAAGTLVINTPGGQSVSIDDSAGSILLTNSADSIIYMDALNGINIEAKTGNVRIASMGYVVIHAAGGGSASVLPGTVSGVLFRNNGTIMQNLAGLMQVNNLGGTTTIQAANGINLNSP